MTAPPALAGLGSGAVETIAIEGVAIPAGPLLRIQGYRTAERVRPAVRRVAEAQAARAQALMTPVVVYRRVAIAACDAAGLSLAGGIRFSAGDFATAFAGAGEAVALVLTLGAALDDEGARLTAAGDMLGALFLDSAGWYAIEQATRAFAAALAGRAAEEGLALTRRLAPGYGDWGLAEQRAFFTLFDGAALPVTLTEGCAMLPTKSRSGLYGLRSVTARSGAQRPG